MHHGVSYPAVHLYAALAAGGETLTEEAFWHRLQLVHWWNAALERASDHIGGYTHCPITRLLGN